MTSDKLCETCRHYLPAEHIGMVCMNVRSARFGNAVGALDGCLIHRGMDKKQPQKKCPRKSLFVQG
jgi:NAD-dependent oxidoreductase involved in siderophore biosynthesis